MKKMDQLLEVIREQNLNIYSVTEISDGQSVTVNLKDCELSESPVCRNVYSVAKAFTMAAVGFLYDEGKIRLEDTIAQVLGALPEGSDPRWGEVTVEDLIRHKTGYLKKEDPVQMFDLDVHDMRAYTQGDWLAFILGRPITGQHGVDGSYTDTGYYVLSRMVAKRAGRPMQDYLREKLFNPTHFRDWAWYACPQGHAYGGTGLITSSTDMAKLGQIWLQMGKWEGKQLLSEEWIRLSLARGFVFGRLRDSRNVFSKGGMFNQRLMFSYDEGCVIAILGYTHEVYKIEDALFPPQ